MNVCIKCMYHVYVNVCMYVCRWQVSSLRTWTSADSIMRWIMQCAETSGTTFHSCKSPILMYVCMRMYVCRCKEVRMCVCSCVRRFLCLHVCM